MALGPESMLAQTCCKCENAQCVPATPRLGGYLNCQVISPGWREVSQPCAFYGPQRKALTRVIPIGLLFGDQRASGQNTCRSGYRAFKPREPGDTYFVIS